MHQDPTSGQLICQKHPNQIPTPWYKVFLVLEDETDEISALIIGRSGEKVFGVPCKDLVFNQRSVDQKQLPMKQKKYVKQMHKIRTRFQSNCSKENRHQPAQRQTLLHTKKTSDCFNQKAKNFCSCLKECWHL
ncbi:uncharacterized protein LOC103939968 isoform X3 [Pyrus x bretschneideri]|uniref:uncharacterized protein LOC103939968 isoform X3 n=1 Tax=Pyrus x bretschneideri TaxID=225117 RepID=UPI002030A326|nr:uncharacterized protein LOC103939968 isoform X3 [Pyrus x bretschneideri]